MGPKAGKTHVPKNLYQRNGVWYARFSTAGQLRRICLRTSDLKLARQRLRGLKTQADNALYGVETAHTWAEAVIGYSRGVLDAGGVKPTTAERYRVSFRQIDPYLKGATLDMISRERLSQIIDERRAEGATNATIRRDLTAISRVLAHAVSKGMTETNAAATYDRRLIRERSAPLSIPTDDQIAVACTMMPPEWSALVRFLRGTGMRLGEALRARWTDLRGNHLTIGRTKNDRPRTIEVSPSVLPVKTGVRLFEAIAEDSVLASRRYGNLRPTRPAMPRFRLHDLRHAYAIDQIRSGRDIYDLSHHLGHSSLTSSPA